MIEAAPVCHEGKTKKMTQSLELSEILRNFVADIKQRIAIMTTLELRTSITADLDQMSIEMLENVSRYVKRLRRRTRNIRPQADATQRQREAAMLFVKNLSVGGGKPVPADERGIDALITEKYDK